MKTLGGGFCCLYCWLVEGEGSWLELTRWVEIFFQGIVLFGLMVKASEVFLGVEAFIKFFSVFLDCIWEKSLIGWFNLLSLKPPQCQECSAVTDWLAGRQTDRQVDMTVSPVQISATYLDFVFQLWITGRGPFRGGWGFGCLGFLVCTVRALFSCHIFWLQINLHAIKLTHFKGTVWILVNVYSLNHHNLVLKHVQQAKPFLHTRLWWSRPPAPAHHWSAFCLIFGLF